MKNKGRRQLHGNGSFNGIANTKSESIILTRPIRQMSARNYKPGDNFWGGERGVSKKFMKKKWAKRVRGYFKSQTHGDKQL